MGPCRRNGTVVVLFQNQSPPTMRETSVSMDTDQCQAHKWQQMIYYNYVTFPKQLACILEFIVHSLSIEKQIHLVGTIIMNTFWVKQLNIRLATKVMPEMNLKKKKLFNNTNCCYEGISRIMKDFSNHLHEHFFYYLNPVSQAEHTVYPHSFCKLRTFLQKIRRFALRLKCIEAQTGLGHLLMCTNWSGAGCIGLQEPGLSHNHVIDHSLSDLSASLKYYWHSA